MNIFLYQRIFLLTCISVKEKFTSKKHLRHRKKSNKIKRRRNEVKSCILVYAGGVVIAKKVSEIPRGFTD